jgi:hypothetical protein
MNESISREELVSQFGAAVTRRSAVLFAGAGLSKSSGYPSWSELIQPLLEEANVPAHEYDAPLDAEYVKLELGNERIKTRIIEMFAALPSEPTAAIKKLMLLPIDEYWTTNYDTLLEQADPDVFRVVADDGFTAQHHASAKRLTKMHGSVSLPSEGTLKWVSDPVLTRSDFEQYETTHPSMWALLKANFLTRSILFLGFSFKDPNIGLLLRISRSLPTSVGRPIHYTVLRREGDARDFELLVKDLTRSGVHVHVIDDFDELESIITLLEIRSREPILMVSGSGAGAEGDVARTFGALLADEKPDISLASLGSPAGFTVSIGKRSQALKGSYRPEGYKFFFRKSPSDEVPAPTDRIGTAVYTDLDMEDLRPYVLSKSRALIAFGGGPRTMAELRLAREHFVPVIPVASSGGAAEEFWKSTTATDCGLVGEDVPQWWARLADPNFMTAANAARKLAALAVHG